MFGGCRGRADGGIDIRGFERASGYRDIPYRSCRSGNVLDMMVSSENRIQEARVGDGDVGTCHVDESAVASGGHGIPAEFDVVEGHIPAYGDGISSRIEILELQIIAAYVRSQFGFDGGA